MTFWTLVWGIVFGAAALMFFLAAVVIAVVGAKDLRDLLSRSDRG